MNVVSSPALLFQMLLGSVLLSPRVIDSIIAPLLLVIFMPLQLFMVSTTFRTPSLFLFLFLSPRRCYPEMPNLRQKPWIFHRRRCGTSTVNLTAGTRSGILCWGEAMGILHSPTSDARPPHDECAHFHGCEEEAMARSSELMTDTRADRVDRGAREGSWQQALCSESNEKLHSQHALS
jgi:hypothetical protein